MTRRYPDTITRLRAAEGSRSASGRWVPGPVTETALAASVQPRGLSDDPTTGGDQISERLRVLTPWRPDVALAAAFEGGDGDRVRLTDGATFTVTTTEAWPGSHVEADLLREP